MNSTIIEPCFIFLLSLILDYRQGEEARLSEIELRYINATVFCDL